MTGGKFNKIAEKKECKTNYGLKFYFDRQFD